MTRHMEAGSFAERMMKKMGWSEGKGLGKDESGIVSSIKVLKRVDGEGLGVRADHSGNDGWTSTTGAFGSALAALTAKYGGDEQDERREKKRKTTRAPRIVRSSVLRSKDTSKYTAHDMKAILGDNESSRKEAKKRRREETSASAADAKPKKKRRDSSALSTEDDKPAKKKRTKESASSSSGESVKPKKKRRKLDDVCD